MVVDDSAVGAEEPVETEGGRGRRAETGRPVEKRRLSSLFRSRSRAPDGLRERERGEAAAEVVQETDPLRRYSTARSRSYGPAPELPVETSPEL